MPKVTPDAATVAGLVEALGGTVIPDAPRLTFDCELSEVRRIIPELNRLGVACDKVGERVEQHRNTAFAALSASNAPRHRSKNSITFRKFSECSANDRHDHSGSAERAG